MNRWHHVALAASVVLAAARLAPAEDLLDQSFGVKKVATGCRFTEGPAAGRAGNLYFSDSRNDRIMRLAPDGKLEVFRTPCGRTNGIILDREGRLVTCQSSGEGGGRRVVRIEKDGKETVLADTYDGKPFIAPNDLCIDARGRIFFTDPYYGPPAEKSQPSSGVYRIDKPGKVTRIIDNLERPNGILILPDGATLLVSDRGTQKLHRYKLRNDGSVEPDGVLYDFSPDRGIDGMCCDVDGNVYGAAGEDKTTGLFVISPAGKLLLHKPMPEFSTNVTFGGPDRRDLFLTATTSVYKMRTLHKGAELAAATRAGDGTRAEASGMPRFEEQTIDDAVQIGYGTAIGDVDGDGKPDVLLADKKQFVWYKNPHWEKHVLAENLTVHDNVCIAARDIDGDSRVEIAVGAQWNPGDTAGSGAVFYLIPPDDRTQKWTPVELHHEPVVHRMRWVKLGEHEFVLVVAPLHGKENRNGQGAGVHLLAYRMPEDPRTSWQTELIDDTLHVTHNLDPAQWDPTTPAEEILYVGREGAMLITWCDGHWTRKPFDRVEGGGEIRMGLHGPAAPFLVTIQPLHGDKLVYYRSGFDRQSGSGDPTAITGRVVLDDGLNAGHAIACADLAGTGAQQVVAGWRSPNRDHKVGLKLYWPTNAQATEWDSKWIDENTMATEDVRIGDLNADGRPDIVAAGRDTHNLKIYWNRPAAAR